MSATGKHTPGPWFHRAIEGGWDGIKTGDSLLICRLAENNPANAARIVECVNSCEGLNPTAIKDVVRALEELVQACDKGDFTDDIDAGMEGEGFVKTARSALSALRTDTDEVKS